MSFVDTSASGYVPGLGSGGRASVAYAAQSVVNQAPPRAMRTVAPLLEVLVDNLSGGPSDVQVQVSTSSSFGTTVFNTTLLNVPDGPANVLATGLTLGTVYYWRARAANAGTTSWGPWSGDASATGPIPWSFRYDAEFSAAAEAIHLSQGVGSDLRSLATASLLESVGFEVILVSQATGSLLENVGFEIVLSSQATALTYEGDVNVDPPVPHIWFLWRPYGFGGNEVWAFGHGFGNPRSEFDGSILFNVGPDYTTDDVNLGINEWYEQIAGPDAYTEDRRIDPGDFFTDPHVDTEVGIIRFVAPIEVVPDQDPATHYAYVTHDHGTSNESPWVMYPTIPVAAGNVQRDPGTKTNLRLSVDFGGDGIEQLYFHTGQVDYVITNGVPQRPPLFTTSARVVTELGTWSTEDSLAAALDVDLGADHRWIPDEARIVPAPGLGTGVTAWEPSVGTTAQQWRFEADSAPYVDPAYTIPSRLGDLAMPAMIFDGLSFGALTADLPTGPEFTFAIAAVLHAPPNGRGTIFSTYRPGAQEPDAYDLELYYEDGRIRVIAGGRYSLRNLSITTGRPVIIVNSVNVTYSQLIVVDDSPTSHVSVGLSMQETGYRGYLGRSWRIDDRIDTASMDVLDVAWWNASMDSAQAWTVANRLDGIYGVTG